MADAKPKRLRDLRNIGKAMLADFELLGVVSVDQLAGCDPNELYDRLQVVTGHRHDPCVLDTFMAAVHEARTGARLNWWAFTPARKAAERAPS
jgi:nucleotidyltransferase/DNA polymerase involved in DNA repair